MAATRVAFAGDPPPGHHDVRIDGPHAGIGFACLDGVVDRDQIHDHKIRRDRKIDDGVSDAF